MLSRQFFLRCFLLLIVVEITRSLGQPTLNEMAEMCPQAPSFESGHSEISHQIRSQTKILEKLAESIQKEQIQIQNLSHEVESNVNNLSNKVDSNVKNLSRDFESKLESVQSGFSKLESEFQLLRIRMDNCPAEHTAEVIASFSVHQFNVSLNFTTTVSLCPIR